VVLKIHMDKVLQHTQAETQCFQLSHPTEVVEVDHGTVMRLRPAARAAAELLVVQMLDPTITLVPMTVETPVWAVEELLDKDFREVRALDLTVSQKTPIKLAVVAVLEALDLVLKMTATKAAWASAVQEQPTIF